MRIRCRRAPSSRLTERGRSATIPRDDQDRVVAGDGAHRFRQPRAVDRERERLRLAGAGANDEHLLHAIDATHELCRRVRQRVHRHFRIALHLARPLIRAVAGSLHEAEFLDVARNRRLRGFEAGAPQAGGAAAPGCAAVRDRRSREWRPVGGISWLVVVCARQIERTPRIHDLCILARTLCIDFH